MTRDYILVEYHDAFKGEDRYRYLIGGPGKPVRFTDDKSEADLYSSSEVIYYFNVFEINGTNMRLEEVEWIEH